MRIINILRSLRKFLQKTKVSKQEVKNENLESLNKHNIHFIFSYKETLIFV